MGLKLAKYETYSNADKLRVLEETICLAVKEYLDPIKSDCDVENLADWMLNIHAEIIGTNENHNED